MLLEGIFAPVTTPFHPDGRLFPRKLETNVERYSRSPLAGLVVLGSTSEADGLTDEETITVLRSAIEASAPEKVMLASVSHESVFRTLRLAEVAAGAGYDAISLRAPVATSPEGMERERLTYFRTVADGAALPVILVSDPDRPLTVAEIGELAGHPMILGLTDAFAPAKRLAAIKAATSSISREVTVTPIFAPVTGRMIRSSVSGNERGFVSAASLADSAGAAVAVETRPALRTRTRRVGFQVLAGTAAVMLPSWQAGANGSLARFAACAPQATCEVWQAFRDGDHPLSEEKQERLRGASGLVEGHAGTGRLKYACDWNGYFGGRPRLPLLSPTAEERHAVERALAGMRN